MKKITGLLGVLVLGFAIVFTSCDNDGGNGDLDLVIEGHFGNEILEFNKEYTKSDGERFIITRSDMFLSDVRLVADNGTEELLSDVIQVYFEFSPGGVKFDFNKVPSGNYESLRFSLGLTPELNSTRPLDYESDHVLNNSGYYWSAWDSYIFSKLEGKTEDANGDIVTGYLYHTGMNELLREVTIPLNYNLKSKESNELRLTFDHEKLFYENGEPIDLVITHDPTDLGVLGKLMDRMANSFNLTD
jgi:hypothetical protein